MLPVLTPPPKGKRRGRRRLFAPDQYFPTWYFYVLINWKVWLLSNARTRFFFTSGKNHHRQMVLLFYFHSDLWSIFSHTLYEMKMSYRMLWNFPFKIYQLMKLWEWFIFMLICLHQIPVYPNSHILSIVNVHSMLKHHVNFTYICFCTYDTYRMK